MGAGYSLGHEEIREPIAGVVRHDPRFAKRSIGIEALNRDDGPARNRAVINIRQMLGLDPYGIPDIALFHKVNDSHA
jgi:hypothetical protein